MHAMARRWLTVAAIMLLAAMLPTPGAAQDVSSPLGLITDAINRERTVCAELDALDADAATTRHRLMTGIISRAIERAEQGEKRAAEMVVETQGLLDNAIHSIRKISREQNEESVRAHIKRAEALVKPSRREREILDEFEEIETQLFLIVLEMHEQSGNPDRLRALTAERDRLDALKRRPRPDLSEARIEIERIEEEFRLRSGEIYSEAESGRIAAWAEKAREYKTTIAEWRVASTRHAVEQRRLGSLLANVNSCLAARLAKDKPETTATAGNAPTGTRPAAPVTPPVTGPSGGPVAQVAGVEWPGLLKVTCVSDGKTDHSQGQMRATFTAPDRVTIEVGPKGRKNEQTPPLTATLGKDGNFAERRKNEAQGYTLYLYQLDGRFTFGPGPDGKTRPTGRGTFEHLFATWALAGILGEAARMTDEEREKKTDRCRGTWQIPPDS